MPFHILPFRSFSLSSLSSLSKTSKSKSKPHTISRKEPNTPTPLPTIRSIGTQTTKTRTHSSRWTQTPPERYISFREHHGVQPPRKSGVEWPAWWAVVGGVVLGWFFSGMALGIRGLRNIDTKSMRTKPLYQKERFISPNLQIYIYIQNKFSRVVSTATLSPMQGKSILVIGTTTSSDKDTIQMEFFNVCQVN
ncbi:uncharacterized protein EAF01_007316 [Botrytis porri]|uniref:uncharacterized protein n=1 Tax=Botrytis porri TaxID=87229 RepID=UPI0018FFAC8F|nr:uncharacterized protein EAF01_007316 [Botrytis porri]KAF7902018.1 hypothetical protein EAF01_007316 [Botrytis porri]